MSTTAVVIIVVVVVAIVLVAALVARPAMRRRRLRETFGPEYDRTVEDTGDERRATAELEDRRRRHQEFELRPLSAEHRDRYRQAWSTVQEEFVDSPRDAVGRADQLIGEVMSDRGYPAGDFDQQAADLSVEHSAVLGHYRKAHTISQRAGADTEPASTEELREALVHYRTLFEDLVEHATPERSTR
ncbi:MAG TPA: hypothetical protein VHZ97_01730 [Pseudonocardiaceae bacterium]|nr:hypothetical protein [Pseudonocardiaceae bacterium]